MHESVLDFLRKIQPSDVAGKYVVEFGSYNVNGTAREVIYPMNPAIYVGYDRIAGPGVDRVADLGQYCRFIINSEKPDVLICLNCLEHTKDWRCLVRNMKYLCKPGGLLVISVPSRGFPHHNPPDYWRFGLNLIRQIFSDMKIEALEPDPQIPGVLLRARALAKTGMVSLEEIQPDKVPTGDADDLEKIWEEL